MALVIEAWGLLAAKASIQRSALSGAWTGCGAWTERRTSGSSSCSGRRGCEAVALHVLQAFRGVIHESVDVDEVALDGLSDMLVTAIGELGECIDMSLQLRDGVAVMRLKGDALGLQLADVLLRLLDLLVELVDLVPEHVAEALRKKVQSKM